RHRLKNENDKKPCAPTVFQQAPLHVVSQKPSVPPRCWALRAIIHTFRANNLISIEALSNGLGPIVPIPVLFPLSTQSPTSPKRKLRRYVAVHINDFVATGNSLML